MIRKLSRKIRRRIRKLSRKLIGGKKSRKSRKSHRSRKYRGGSTLERNHTINFIWINKDPVPAEQEYIMIEKFEGGKKLSFEDYFVKPITLWSIYYPDTSIVIWYDSIMLEDNTIALDNTVKACKYSVKKYGISEDNIIFRDVREIPIVRDNKDKFNSEVHIALRSDSLRIIVAHHVLLIENPEQDATFTYCDFSIIPEPKDVLFDYDTKKVLSNFGLVLLKSNNVISSYENGFFMLSNINKNTLEAIKDILINNIIDKIKIYNRNKNHQIIYDLYKNMIVYALYINNNKYTINIRFKFKIKDDIMQMNKNDILEDLTDDTIFSIPIEFINKEIKNKDLEIEVMNIIEGLGITKDMCAWRQSSYGSTNICIKPMPELPPI